MNTYLINRLKTPVVSWDQRGLSEREVAMTAKGVPGRTAGGDGSGAAKARKRVIAIVPVSVGRALGGASRDGPGSLRTVLAVPADPPCAAR